MDGEDERERQYDAGFCKSCQSSEGVLKVLFELEIHDYIVCPRCDRGQCPRSACKKQIMNPYKRKCECGADLRLKGAEQ